MSTRLRIDFGQKRLTPFATPSTDSTYRILKKTSYELLTGKKLNVSYFRVFESKCFILIKRARNSKFTPKAVEGFLFGYDSNTKVYRVFNKSLWSS
jgi:phage antirepressor YoqD-like protein